MSSICSKCSAPVPSSLTEVPASIISVAVAPGTLARHLEFLTTNTPPEGAEITFIREVVSKTGARLADVEAEISRLHSRLQQLEEERISLSRYHAPNKAILSPLRRMPSEILAEIFSWTLPSVHDAYKRRKFHINNSPWVLTLVSSRWRALAISNPSLWSLVVIRSPTYKRGNPNPMSMIKTQIQRAQKLKVYFYGDSKRALRHIEMFRCLAEHSPRWEELHITLTAHISPLLWSLRDRLPSLRELSMKWDSPESLAEVVSIDCFQTAPSLLAVGIFNQYRHLSIPLPAHQLTLSDLDGPWEMHRDILKLAKNLVQARIFVDFDDEPWPNPGEPINLLLLRRLSVSHVELFSYLTAPAVQEIAFYLEIDDEPDQSLRHLKSFVERSRCTLRRLSFRGTPAPDTAVEILRKYPSVIELGIITSRTYGDREATDEGANALISHLTIPHPSGSVMLAPQLSKLYVGCRGKSSIDYALYLQMLRSRWKTNDCSLNSAELPTEFGPKPDSLMRSGLDVLCRDGLNILLLEGSEAGEIIEWWTMSIFMQP
ncbi:hypothetical protein DFH09DRAFT_1366446 [Mycena vulgaris]|nr:hypothetical protein DFH09DRAFT_1366446 [Mycena vulgaris]